MTTTLPDPCEIKINGIPRTVALDADSVANRTLEALRLSSLKIDVIETRNQIWLTRDTNSPSTTSEVTYPCVSTYSESARIKILAARFVEISQNYFFVLLAIIRVFSVHNHTVGYKWTQHKGAGTSDLFRWSILQSCRIILSSGRKESLAGILNKLNLTIFLRKSGVGLT